MKTDSTYKELMAEIAHLKERILYLERQLYGSKRDRVAAIPSDGLPTLFDDEFKEALDEKAKKIENTAKEIEEESKKRRNREKKKAERPSKYRYHGLEERTRVIMPDGVNVEDCEVIGKDVTRILRFEPSKTWVEVIERPVLRKKEDKGTLHPKIFQAPAPVAVIGGNHVGADLLANIVIDKYQYHLPEYRQIKRFADTGLILPTSTLNNWVHSTAYKLEPVYEALRQEIRGSDYLQIDEVPWRIADRPGKSRHGYAWQFFDSRPESHGTYFLYMNGSRAGEVPRSELKSFKGAIQTDGYIVYDYFELQEGVILLACLAHIRRKFVEAQKSYPQLARQAVEWIALLYQIEANLRARNASFEEIANERQKKAIPIMDAMEAWMKMSYNKCTPSDPMGKAIDYAYKLWPRIRLYATDGRYNIDNNPVERNQRPTVMGRKNYLFSKNDNGAIDNAIFYSLLESCDIVGVDKFEWLEYTLKNLKKNASKEEAKIFTPYNYKKNS